MDLFSTLYSGSGAWNPLIWLITFILILLLAFLIRSYGRSDYKKGTDQTQPFISGNHEPDENLIHVRASNLYWGYLEALKSYYKRVTKIHTGNVVDYILWLFGTMTVVIIIGLWG